MLWRYFTKFTSLFTKWCFTKTDDCHNCALRKQRWKRINVCKWLTRCKFASNVVFLCFPLLKKLFRCMPVSKGTFLPDLEHIYTVRFGHTWLLTASSLQLGWRLHEGDHFHPQENIDKMAKGEPLTDQVCVSVSSRTIIFCHVNYCLDATDRTQQVRLHWSRW